MPDHSSIKVLSTLTPMVDEALEALIAELTQKATAMPEGRDIGFNERKALAVIKMRAEEILAQM